jgi:hypothetical protein
LLSKILSFGKSRLAARTLSKFPDQDGIKFTSTRVGHKPIEPWAISSGTFPAEYLSYLYASY